MTSDVNEPVAARQVRVRSRPRPAEVRSRILAAAAGVFAQRGFTAASVDEVAAAAGFTKGAVYSNFENKDDLFFALLGEQVKARIAVARQALAEAGGSSQEQMWVMGEALSRVLTADRDWQLLFLEFWQRAVREPAVGRRFAAHREGMRTLIAEAFRNESQRRGATLALPPERMATVALALSNGLAIEELASPGTVPPTLLSEVLVRLSDGPAAG